MRFVYFYLYAKLYEYWRKLNIAIQCESKKSPLRFSDIFSQTVGNF